jgi:hypothetical protein
MQEVVNNLPGFKLNCAGKTPYNIAGDYSIKTDAAGDHWFTLHSATEVKGGNMLTSGFAIYPNSIDKSQIEAVFNSCLGTGCTSWKLQIDYNEFNKEVKDKKED